MEIPTVDIDGVGAMYASRRHYGVELTWLYIEEAARGLGIGRFWMEELCAWADKNRVRVWTWAKPFDCGRASPYALVPFYASLGFSPIRPETRPNFYRRIRLVRG